MAQSTLGALAEWDPPPEEKECFLKLINILDQSYPDDWRAWVINALTYEDLFGDKLSSELECKLRFAVPTVQLAQAFGSDSSLSERRYKKIKRTLLTWPLGRALIYSPLFVMSKIHPVRAYNKFYDTLSNIKHDLISREEAEKILKGGKDMDIASTASSSRASKRSHSSEHPPTAAKEPRLCELMVLERRQTLVLEKKLELTFTTQKNVTDLISTQRPTESPNPAQDDDESCLAPSDDEGWAPPPLIDEQIDTVSCDNNKEAKEVLEDFAPGTKESEAKVAQADEVFVQQVIDCQRFNSEGWQNIRYAEVQKMFQATPAFTVLKTNSNLATATPTWQLVSVLEKMDLCLGAITHGLLQQRRTFQHIYENAAPQQKTYISKNFLAQDSAFRKTSDALLQYACGKRAEVIQQRRSIYKPPNKTLNELLHAIPPSEKHLFAEPQLSDFVKEQGGTSKLFPGHFRKNTSTTTPTGRTTTRDSRPRQQQTKTFSEPRAKSVAPRSSRNYYNHKSGKTRVASKQQTARPNKFKKQ